MDRLEEIKADIRRGRLTFKDMSWLVSQIETLRLDNTYLQQRLKMEVERK